MIISPKLIRGVKETVVPPIKDEYVSLFRKEGVNISPNELDGLISQAFKNATETYSKLGLFKTYSLLAYTSYWIREELIKLLTIRTLRKVSKRKDSSRQDQDLEPFGKFFSILPLGSSFSIMQRLFKPSTLTQRKNIFRQYKPILDKLEKPFRDLVQLRNSLAQKKGCKDFIFYIRQMYLNRIPDEEYDCFVQNVDQVIAYLYSQLPKVENLPDWFYSRYNQPCFLCLIPFSKDLDTKKVLDIVGELYSQLKAFLPKIQIVYTEGANTRYVKEDDLYKVSLRKKVNRRHQMIDLVHELGHVIYFIDSFANNVDVVKGGKYVAEKEALRIEFIVLNAIDPTILKAYYADLLQVILRSLFELTIYTKPVQDYSQLYAQLFRKCFPDSLQRSNPLYLFDERIVAQPLSSLAYTIASVNLLVSDKD